MFAKYLTRTLLSIFKMFWKVIFLVLVNWKTYQNGAFHGEKQTNKQKEALEIPVHTNLNALMLAVSCMYSISPNIFPSFPKSPCALPSLLNIDTSITELHLESLCGSFCTCAYPKLIMSLSCSGDPGRVSASPSSQAASRNPQTTWIFGYHSAMAHWPQPMGRDPGPSFPEVFSLNESVRRGYQGESPQPLRGRGCHSPIGSPLP